jgi:hypothetical protein
VNGTRFNTNKFTLSKYMLYRCIFLFYTGNKKGRVPHKLYNTFSFFYKQTSAWENWILFWTLNPILDFLDLNNVLLLLNSVIGVKHNHLVTFLKVYLLVLLVNSDSERGFPHQCLTQ